MNTRKIRRIFRNFKNRPNKQQAEQIKMLFNEFNETKTGKKHMFATFPLDITSKRKENKRTYYDIGCVLGLKFDASFRVCFKQNRFLWITIKSTDLYDGGADVKLKRQNQRMVDDVENALMETLGKLKKLEYFKGLMDEPEY